AHGTSDQADREAPRQGAPRPGEGRPQDAGAPQEPRLPAGGGEAQASRRPPHEQEERRALTPRPGACRVILRLRLRIRGIPRPAPACEASRRSVTPTGSYAPPTRYTLPASPSTSSSSPSARTRAAWPVP